MSCGGLNEEACRLITRTDIVLSYRDHARRLRTVALTSPIAVVGRGLSVLAKTRSLFVDLSNGDLLQRQDTVTIDWKSSEGASAGTLRVWRCHIERGWRRTRALPFNWEFSESAPTTLAIDARSSEAIAAPADLQSRSIVVHAVSRSGACGRLPQRRS